VKESGMGLGIRNGTKWSARAATTFNCAAAIVCSFSVAQRRMLRTDVWARMRTPARTTYPNGVKAPGCPRSTARLIVTRVLRRPGQLNSFNTTNRRTPKSGQPLQKLLGTRNVTYQGIRVQGLRFRTRIFSATSCSKHSIFLVFHNFVALCM